MVYGSNTEKWPALMGMKVGVNCHCASIQHMVCTSYTEKWPVLWACHLIHLTFPAVGKVQELYSTHGMSIIIAI